MIYVKDGGASLNFKVVGGTSAPSNPKENIIWVNTDTAIHAWDFSATEPHRRSNNKNLIVYPFYNTTTTINGVTITDNGDGTLTLNGTCTANGDFRLSHSGVNRLEFILQPGTYQVSGNVNSSESSHHVKVAYSYDNWATTTWGGSDGKPFVVEKEAKARANLTILKGATFSNLLYKPQLEKGSTATSFVKGDATGQVWVTTGKSSAAPFNALKKNVIMVYPLSAKQYVNGAWVDKEAKSYQNGAWTGWWNGELYDAGDEFEFITGGWQAFATSSNSPVKPTITKSSTSVNIKLSSPYNEGPYGGAYVTKNKISFKGKNTLKFTGDSSGENNGRCMICVWSSLVSGGSSPSVAQLFFPSGGMTNKTISLDIGGLNLTDSYYVGMYIYNAHWVTMKKMWLE